MSLRRLLVGLQYLRDAIFRSAPLADGLLKSLVSLFVIICCIALTSPPSVSAKPFALSFPAGWSLAGFVNSVGARSENAEMQSAAAGVKPYTGRRVSNDTLRMIYYHDQAVAVVELGSEKLLMNCEIIETFDELDSQLLLKQLSVINRPYLVTFPQMVKLMSQCQQVSYPMFKVDDYSQLGTIKPTDGVEGVEAESNEIPPPEGWRDDTEARARIDSGGVYGGLLGGGSPLTLLQGIIPGTKWCGTGDIAADYHDLGAARNLDRCCRTHDLCPTKVRAFSQRYNLTNNSLYSKSHCKCDDMLFECLKSTNTSASHLMGHIYFNIVQVPCLVDTKKGKSFRDAKHGF